MTTDKARVMLTLDQDTYLMLKEVADATGLTVAGIINRFIGSHVAEVTEYFEWLVKQEKGSRTHMLGKNLLVSYGPDDLTAGIRKLDPKHRFISEKLAEEVKKRQP